MSDVEVEAQDVAEEYDLPLFGSILSCPKCGGEGFELHYHPAAVMESHCGQKWGWPAAQGVPEHVCRTCLRCGYGWPESTYVPS